jgi:hypothetical protein
VITAVWSTLGSESVKHHAARLFTGAAVFWLTGAALVVWDRNATSIPGQTWTGVLSAASRPLQELPTVGAGALLLVAVTVVVVSALLAEKLALSVLRVLEGYWRRPARLRARRVRHWREARADAMKTYQSLQASRSATTACSDADEVALARAASVLRAIPPAPLLVMPTRLGNLMRAAELRPLHKHGVDAIALWPHLWLVLPADTRTEVAAARNELDAAARGWLWGALFVVWTPWAWWAALVSVLAATLAYAACLRAAETYAALVESAFDVHLPLLYQVTRLPLPARAADEPGHGARLTRYLRDGSDDPTLLFVPAKEG